jgi:hypothetical protein
MDNITIEESGTEVTISADFGCTPQEFAEACGYNPDKEWQVFRDKPYEGSTIPAEHECEEPMAVDEGDAFIIIPRYV